MSKKEKKLINFTEVISSFPLQKEFIFITWDKSTKIFVGLCIFLFVIGVAGKFHFSHSPIWYQIFGNDAKLKKEVIWGKPQGIRMDEWLTDVPHIISQSELGYPISNPAIGPGTSAILQGMPVNNIITFFRPLHWGFMIFDVERGLSFLWMFRTIGCLISLFFLFNILTKGNFILSIFGSVAIFLSSGIQWWGIFTEPITFSVFAVIGFLGMLYSTKSKNIVLFGLLFTIFTYSFITTPLYPPRQVPLLYLMLFITISFVFVNKKIDIIKSNFSVKFISFIISLFFISGFLFYFFLINKDTIEIVFNTVYPGKRVSNGGDLDWTKLFSEFYWTSISAEQVPQRWKNVCEASGFLMFFPIIFYGIAKNFFLKKKQNLMVVVMSSFMILGLYFIFIGFPTIISKITFFSMVTPVRFLYGFGVANYILLILYVNSKEYNDNSVSLLENISIGILSFFLVYFNGYFTNIATNMFFTKTSIILVAFFFTVIYLLILNISIKFSTPILFTLVLLFSFRNFLSNPLSRTLTEITENPFIIQAKAIVSQDKNSGWIVFGPQMIFSNFLKTSGANVWSGVKYTPNYTNLKVLDLKGVFDSVYNRYAHTVYYSNITPNDTVLFKKVEDDNYSVFIDPCSEKLNKIGINYFFFTYLPQPNETRCMKLISSGNFNIYKRND